MKKKNPTEMIHLDEQIKVGAAIELFKIKFHKSSTKVKVTSELGNNLHAEKKILYDTGLPKKTIASICAKKMT